MQRRYSRQRELIYNCVRNTKEHPTADMVYRWLLPDNPNLSRGTVYRNLKLLAEDGLIRLMPFPVERYDAHTSAHSHFCCTVCGSVYDVELAYQKEIDQQVSTEEGFCVQWHDLVFYGVCQKCMLKQLGQDELMQKEGMIYDENVSV